jgi:hypothetical protein
MSCPETPSVALTESGPAKPAIAGFNDSARTRPGSLARPDSPALNRRASRAAEAIEATGGHSTFSKEHFKLREFARIVGRRGFFSGRASIRTGGSVQRLDPG